MTSPASPRQSETTLLLPEQADMASGDTDPQMQRIGRIGQRLFGVQSCLITFGTMQSSAPHDDSVGASMALAFCRSLPLQDEPLAVLDTRHHLPLRQRHGDTGANAIRFYAAYPIYSKDNVLLGRVSLIDYAPRMYFSDVDMQMLADLAALAERELALRSMSESQLHLERKNKNLRRKSLIDPLLGTWNRGAIMRILTIEAIRCDKARLPLSLIVVDLDYFKKINDTYGHPVGDTVLIKIASRLRSCIRPQEALGRYGGEEFLVVLPGASASTAMAVAERMRHAVATQPEVVGGTTLNLTISAGVASTDMFPTVTTEELISRADAALYVAKDLGRNRVANATTDLS
jgi:diguanylate cyclase (GGDEF)-like protein